MKNVPITAEHVAMTITCVLLRPEIYSVNIIDTCIVLGRHNNALIENTCVGLGRYNNVLKKYMYCTW